MHIISHFLSPTSCPWKVCIVIDQAHVCLCKFLSSSMFPAECRKLWTVDQRRRRRFAFNFWSIDLVTVPWKFQWLLNYWSHRKIFIRWYILRIFTSSLCTVTISGWTWMDGENKNWEDVRGHVNRMISKLPLPLWRSLLRSSGWSVHNYHLTMRIMAITSHCIIYSVALFIGHQLRLSTIFHW